MLPAKRIMERERLRNAIRSEKPIDKLTEILYQQTKTSIETKADFEKYLLGILEKNKSPIDELDSLQCPAFYMSGDFQQCTPHVDDVLKRAYESSQHLCKAGFLDQRSVDKLQAVRKNIVNKFSALASTCSHQTVGSLEKLNSLQYMIRQFVARIVSVFTLKIPGSPLLYDHFTLEQQWVIRSLAQAAINTIAKLTFTLDSMNAEFLVLQFEKLLAKRCSEMDSGTYEIDSDDYTLCFGVSGELAPKQRPELQLVNAREGYRVSFSQGANRSGVFREEVNKILNAFPRLLRTRLPLLDEKKFIAARKDRDEKAESYYQGRDQYLALLCEAYKRAFLLPREKRSYFLIALRVDNATLPVEKYFLKEIHALLEDLDENHTMTHLQVRYRLQTRIRDLKTKIAKANQKRDGLLAKEAASRVSRINADAREEKLHKVYFHPRKVPEMKRAVGTPVMRTYQEQIANVEEEIRGYVAKLACEEIYSSSYRTALSLKSATSPVDDSILRFFAVYYPNLAREILADVITILGKKDVLASVIKVLRNDGGVTANELVECTRKFKLMLYLGHEAYRLCEIIFAQHLPGTAKESKELKADGSCWAVVDQHFDFLGVRGLEVMTIPGLNDAVTEAVIKARKDSQFRPLYEMEAAIESAFSTPQNALRLADTMKRQYSKRFHDVISTPASQIPVRLVMV